MDNPEFHNLSNQKVKINIYIRKKELHFQAARKSIRHSNETHLDKTKTFTMPCFIKRQLHKLHSTKRFKNLSIHQAKIPYNYPKRKIDESYLQGTWWSWLTVHQPQTIIVNSVIKLLHFTVVIVKTSPYLTKLIFCHVKMEIANIQPSGSTWIGTSASTWCSSNGWIRLNKILFSFWRFNHDRLTKKRLSRECYCHRYRHYIIKFNIPATKTVLYQEELIKDMHIHVNIITNKKQENIKSSWNLMYAHAHAIRRDKTY